MITLRILLAICVLVPQVCHSQQPAIAPDLTSYQMAVSRIKNESQSWAMAQCIKNWAVVANDRQRALKTLSPRRDHRGSHQFLLEIGNSGFPKYNYIYLEGNKLKAVLWDGRHVHKSLSQKTLSDIIAVADREHQTENWADIEDGDCYFLTFSNSNRKTIVLSYGSLRLLATDSLIRKILMAAGQKQ